MPRQRHCRRRSEDLHAYRGWLFRDGDWLLVCSACRFHVCREELGRCEPYSAPRLVLPRGVSPAAGPEVVNSESVEAWLACLLGQMSPEVAEQVAHVCTLLDDRGMRYWLASQNAERRAANLRAVLRKKVKGAGPLVGGAEQVRRAFGRHSAGG